MLMNWHTFVGEIDKNKLQAPAHLRFGQVPISYKQAFSNKTNFK
jgi:hypothetical protein